MIYMHNYSGWFGFERRLLPVGMIQGLRKLLFYREVDTAGLLIKQLHMTVEKITFMLTHHDIHM